MSEILSNGHDVPRKPIEKTKGPQQLRERLRYVGKPISETQRKKLSREISEKLWALVGARGGRLEDCWASLGYQDWVLEEPPAFISEEVFSRIDRAESNEAVREIFERSGFEDTVFQACKRRIMEINPGIDLKKAREILADGEN